MTGTLTVTPAALTVTADDQTRVYGAANPALTVSYSGFVNGDTAASLTTPAAFATTATAASTPGRIRSRRAARVERELHVQLRERHADGDAGGADGHGERPDQDLRRGEPGVDGELQRLRQRRHGGEPDDAADRADDGDDHERASGPIRSRRAARSSANYTFSYVSGTLTVTKAPLTVTADDQTQDLRRGEPGADGELQRVRQRRHGGEPDDAADADDDGDGGERGRDVSDHGRAARRARTTASATSAAR